ncbi:organic hydroperoxide resistance protein [Frankia sp. Mgl5]|uniref:Osmotically inducible protein C n=1 Tax=Parafrankia soli TaxID=2599596 RepID=A0A1S1Q533_9ACTN|nr:MULTISPECIES: organic hydroperoxide resistance protein [Frankiaceae]ABW09482.1 OsmC family protein [Frankia sp. EAN1pec]CAI7979028.1 peroxiredoxin [Frankia sp. Hr75.2]MCK9930093.1 organic hydroperoxide resistance protein [Frankia sp. Mgl5]OHV27284.1 osmotically inducible protein C [Parafrankia soli]TCJ35366.1 organic hydroperoxide resistance protein [Parafrankia sp. BMG5.11]
MAAPLYTATSTAWGGRDGRVVSNDNRIDLQLSMPKGLGGDDGPGTNPEQLFATGYAACFHGALKAVARERKIDVTDSAVTVSVSISRTDEGLDLSTRIEAQIPGVDPATGRELLDLAHAKCPYSRATRGNIAAEVTLVDGDS